MAKEDLGRNEQPLGVQPLSDIIKKIKSKRRILFFIFYFPFGKKIITSPFIF